MLKIYDLSLVYTFNRMELTWLKRFFAVMSSAAKVRKVLPPFESKASASCLDASLSSDTWNQNQKQGNYYEKFQNVVFEILHCAVDNGT